MTPVAQTRFGRPTGNCWAACIASILDLPLETVDWSADMPAEDIELPDGSDCTPEWIERQRVRLEALGYWQLRLEASDERFIPVGAHYIALGKNSAGVGHACVYRAGELVHNPNPASSDTTLVDVEWVCVLVRR